MQMMTELAVEIANQEIDSGVDLHIGTPAPDEHHFPQPVFPEEESQPFLRTEYVSPQPIPSAVHPRRSFAEYLFAKRRRDYRIKCATIDSEYECALQAERAREDAWREEQVKMADVSLAAHLEWDKRRLNFEDNEIQRYLNAVTMTDASYIATLISTIIDHVSWPYPMEVAVGISETCKVVTLDIDLIDSNSVDDRIYVFLKARHMVECRALSQTAKRQRYLRFVHAALFRAIGETFSTMGLIANICASAFSDENSATTGNLERQCVLSVLVDRPRWAKINFDALGPVNPVEALAVFPNRRRLTQGHVLTPVAPLDVDID
jgi:hypothetical protein